VTDRPAVVERILGTLRRRTVSVSGLTVSRASATTQKLVVDVEMNGGMEERMRAELEASPDVIHLERTRRAEEPDAAAHSEKTTGAYPMSSATLYEQTAADPELIRGRRVAVIGYGSQGHAHALNLRDSGATVVVGLHEGSGSAERARKAGLTVMAVDEAAQRSDLIAILIPDPIQPDVYHKQIEPHLKKGDVILFAHGFNVHYKEIQPPEGVDVVLVAPKSPGDMVRREYQAGRGVPALIGVHQDASGKARDLALSYAHALGCTRAGVLDTDFGSETETDLFGEQAVLCGGFSALVKAGFETLVDAGYDPRLAYFECLHELKLIVDLAYAKGLSGMRAEVSDTAEFGDYVSGPRVVGEASRTVMKDILGEIQSGAFARRWIDEWRSGGDNFKRMREEEGRHPINEVGTGLRSRMAWLHEEGAAS
jgi:ketol-acid reductoisomerase